MNRSLCFHPLALTAWDKIRLFGGGVLAFRPNSGNERADCADDFRSKERPADWGKVTKVAKRFIAGEYGAKSYFDVACDEKIDSGSLKNTLWRLQNAGKPSKRRRAA